MEKLPEIYRPKKGLLPTIKSWFFGDDSFTDYLDNQTYVNASGDMSIWRHLNSSHIFNRKSLKALVDIGYTNSPAGFGIINKILLAQRNINFVPYWKGTPWKGKIKSYSLDMNFALQMLITTGTCMVYKKEIIGFDSEGVVLNTLDIEELYIGGKFSYRYYIGDGNYIVIPNEYIIIIPISDIGRRDTQMGLPPLQAALMPIESLKEMYVADTSTLKNKGSDVLITNDSDTPIIEEEVETMDKKINDRVRGARKSGSIATSTAKLRVLNLGRTAKELALWDGYKIKIRDLCNVLQVDSGQFNDPDNKKFTNVLESNRALYNDCVIPFTKLITENKDLKKFLGYDIYLDTSNIDCLQVSQTARAEKATTITNAIVGLNEDVKAGTISEEIAVKILVSEWGFDEAEAKGYIKTPDAVPPTEPPVPIQ